MVIKLIWKEGRKERVSETEIPKGKSWEEVEKQVFQLVQRAYKYSDEEIPEGLDILK